MTSKMRLNLSLLALILFGFGYLVLGLGFQNLNTACYDARHKGDLLEPASNTTSTIIEIWMWPLFLFGLASDEVSCAPLQTS